MSILTHVWTRDNDIVAGCPAVTIIDGMPGIVAGTASGDLVALDGTGTELWRQSIGARVSTWPVVDDVPGTGRCILAADYAGMIACMTPDGENVWRTQLKGGLNEYNSVSVVRGGATAFVASSRCGVVTGLSVDGAIAWEFHTHPEHYTRKVGTGTGPCAIGDVDGDGRDEIAFSAADGYLYCLDCDGGFRWNLYIGDNSQYSSPVMMQLDAGPCVLCGGNADVVYAVSGDGQVVWSQRGTGAGYMDVALSVGDINGDGKDEVVFVHQGRALQAMNGRGEMLWSRFDYLGGDQSFGPSLADIDGDGNLELLFTQRGGETLFVIDGNGELLEEHEMNGGMLGAPVVADVDGDGLLEVLTVSQSDGELRCFDTAASAVPGSAPWPTSRGSFDGRANRLGDVVAVTPRSITAPETTHLTRNSPDSVRLGMNDISFDADPPLGESALIEISALGQDGIVKRAVTQGEDRDCLRLEVLEPGEQMLTATAIDAESWRRTGLSEEHIDVGEFAEERGSAVELLAALRFDDQSSGDLRKELDRIHRRMRFRWAEIEEQIAAYEDLPQEARRELISDVNRELARLRREVGCQALRIRTSSQMGKPVDFLPWETGHPWVPFDPETDIPPDDLLSDLSIRTDGRAHEAVAVEFANVLMDPLDLRVWIDPTMAENGDTVQTLSHFTLRQYTSVPTITRIVAPDAIPALGESGLLRIGASASARLWIDVDTGDLTAGTYETTLHIRSLGLAESTLDVPVKWIVADVSLPEVMPLHLCTWQRGMSLHFPHAMDKTMEDLQNHHNSVFTGLPKPEWTYDADGNLVDRPSWDDLDWYLDRMRPQNIVLLQGYPLTPADSEPIPYSDSWKTAFAALLPELVEHLEEKGFGYDRWAFYPIDEPGLKAGVLTEELERFARFVKSVNAEVRVYTNPYRGMTVADLKRVDDVVDIYQPAGKVVDSENPDRIDHIKTTDHIHWIFEGIIPAKDFVEPTCYWRQIWTAWEIGFTGIGYWTYCTTNTDLWSARSDYVMVYQGAEGPVPSVRWQALRIGIEDHARLVRLRDVIATARDAGRAEVADQAERRLGEMVVEGRTSRWEPSVIARIRGEVIDLTLKLAKEHE